MRTFGHHPKDGAPQGIFCANGQCAQCSVVADGLPVKSCMVTVRPGMDVQPLDGLPVLPDVEGRHQTRPIETVDVECLIIGGGPAGLTAAIELGKAGVRALIVDDKHRLGGKLVLQTHKFFGSIEACHAGTRGIDIATKLEKEVRQFENIRVWLNSTVLVGVLRPPGRASCATTSSTSSCAPTSCSSPPARARNRWSSPATRCPASTARARSRRWSTAIWCGPPRGCSSSAAATSA